MDPILKEIRSYLQNIIDRIDSGTCKSSEPGAMEIVRVLKKYTEEREIPKTEAAEYLHVSVSTFDRMIKDGKIPKGTKTKGDRILRWRTSDLDNSLKTRA